MYTAFPVSAENKLNFSGPEPATNVEVAVSDINTGADVTPPPELPLKLVPPLTRA